jgi:putative endopeptidase
VDHVKIARIALVFILSVSSIAAQSQPGGKPSQKPTLPYCPSLDVSSMDPSVKPCVNFYQYSCGGWRTNNPIPNDETRWSVYGKLYEDNLELLRELLEQAASSSEPRDKVKQEAGDFYGACMDEATVEKRGISPIEPQLREIDDLQSTRDLAPLVARLQLAYGGAILFRGGSRQDFDNSEEQIAAIAQGGLGLPDRDYYVAQDDKSKEIRGRYVEHVQKVFELIDESAADAQRDAATVMRMETGLAQASLTRVERRDPYKEKHKMGLQDLNALAPNFDWSRYFQEASYPVFTELNVGWPEFFKEVNGQLASDSLGDWKTYLRFQVVNSASPNLSAAFVDENYDFYRKYLRGAKEQQSRWKRCVAYTDNDLSEALGELYVTTVFSPQVKQDSLAMIRQIEDAMAERIKGLDWMSPETKEQAVAKLRAIRNKVGYPGKWRDYSPVKIGADDFAGNVQRLAEFEAHRDINKVGKPVDHDEWGMSAPTVDAYFNASMNDINFPAGVLQPPLYDPKMDAAPNYGDTGGTMGHELTHAFDDHGSQFDARGNLKNWWTEEDRKKFDERTKCIVDQYAQYVVVDDVHINSKLTLGEDVADLGGEILAYMAWKVDTRGQKLDPIDGLTPDQRFFIGFAQWDCSNERPEDSRLRARTDPHSPATYRINGVIENMPEFARAFACKAGDPMVKPQKRVCKVW